jgi:ubiquinone/menaquinone biosynthesis C-methylase UbiE
MMPVGEIDMPPRRGYNVGAFVLSPCQAVTADAPMIDSPGGGHVFGFSRAVPLPCWHIVTVRANAGPMPPDAGGKTLEWGFDMLEEREPMQTVTRHEDIVRQEFTKQADAYAANPVIASQDRATQLVRVVQPTPHDRVLEVATGPGYVAMAFATCCREVVGVDLTEAPLVIAEKTRQERGLANVRFETADANQLSFADATFDVVVCRFAFHHFPEPQRVLSEMVRVCRRAGTVAIEDLVVSEHPERAAFHNRLENLRDPSHTAAMPLSRLLSLFAAAGLEVERVQSGTFPQSLERWLQNAQTPPDKASQVRNMVERDAAEDLSGLYPFRNPDNQWCFTQRTAVVVGRKLRV